MDEDQENNDDHFQELPSEKINFVEEEIRISSSGENSPSIQDGLVNTKAMNDFDIFDKIIEQLPNKSPLEQQKQETFEQPRNQPASSIIHKPNDEPEEEVIPKKEDHSIIEQLQKQWIIKQAQMQRIGGTYDFFAYHLDKYKKHLLARKIVLTNINSNIDRNKMIKARAVIVMKQYLRDYSVTCEEFHQKAYKFQFPQRQESDNRIVNVRIELKAGFQRLFHLRKQIGNQMSRLDKFMKTTTNIKLDKAMEVYWGSMVSPVGKAIAKKEYFQEKEKKFQKRIEKIGKVYTKGRVGTEIDEDVLQQMLRFVKEERELRLSIYDWGKELMNLRKGIMKADYALFAEFEAVISQLKNFNNNVYQLQKKKYNFIDRLKNDIERNYLFQKLCTPLDSDYILSIMNFKNKSTLTLLKQKDYQEYFNEEYFGDVIGETTQFLKGTIVKTFSTKNQDQELVKTVSGNLVYYNKKNLDVKYKMKIANTTATFEGFGCVILKEVVKGIIFDSDHIEKIYFKDDNRAEELVLYLSSEFGQQLK